MTLSTRRSLLTRSLLAILGVGCSRSPISEALAPEAEAAPSTLLTPWQLPEGCTVIQPRGTRLLRDAAEAAESIACTAGKLGVDFTAFSLVVSRRELSPATVDVRAFDDGTTITFVSRQRTPCASAPRPMPTPLTLVYRIAAGPRTLRETAITLPPTCR